MSYRIPLPEGSRRPALDLVEPNSTAVQRFVRREGLAGYEPPTAAALLALFDAAGPGFTFFDVGANSGLYAMLAATAFEPSAVHAFEPTPATVAVLDKIVRANRADVTVVGAAVGDAPGRATLHLSDKSDASNSLVGGFKVSSAHVDVDVVTIDDHVRATGTAPDVMKIDVETFEPAVLAGARSTIERHRPAIVIEVLNRRGHDHGEEISTAMAPFGYHYYELSATPSWTPRDRVVGRSDVPDHDWLLAPNELPPDFGDRVATWRSRLADCGPERNSRVPVLRSVEAAYRRGGPREVLATARRYLGRGGKR